MIEGSSVVGSFQNLRFKIEVASSSCKVSFITDLTQTMIDLTQYTTLMTVYSTEQETYYDFKPCGVIDDNDKDPRDDCIGAKGCKSYSATTSISAGSPDDPVSWPKP